MKTRILLPDLSGEDVSLRDTLTRPTRNTSASKVLHAAQGPQARPQSVGCCSGGEEDAAARSGSSVRAPASRRSAGAPGQAAGEVAGAGLVPLLRQAAQSLAWLRHARLESRRGKFRRQPCCSFTEIGSHVRPFQLCRMTDRSVVTT